MPQLPTPPIFTGLCAAFQMDGFDLPQRADSVSGLPGKAGVAAITNAIAASPEALFPRRQFIRHNFATLLDVAQLRIG